MSQWFSEQIEHAYKTFQAESLRLSIEWLRGIFNAIMPAPGNGHMQTIMNALGSTDAIQRQLEQTQRDLKQWKDAVEVQREHANEQTRKVAALQGDIAQRDREIEALRKAYERDVLREVPMYLVEAKPPAVTQKEMENALKWRLDDVVLVLTKEEAQQIRSLLGFHMSSYTLTRGTKLGGVHSKLEAYTEAKTPWRGDSSRNYVVLEPKE